MTQKAVIDTNIFTGALMRGDGVNRKILELCFLDEIAPLMGDALYKSYSSCHPGLDPGSGKNELDPCFRRDDIVSESEREDFFNDFCAISLNKLIEEWAAMGIAELDRRDSLPPHKRSGFHDQDQEPYQSE